MEQNTENSEFLNELRSLLRSNMKNFIIEAKSSPVAEVTQAARLESAKKTHDSIMTALKGGKIVSVPTRKTQNFEEPAVDHHLVVHQGTTMLVDPKGNAKVVAGMSPSNTGHIAISFKEKNKRAAKTVYLHAAHGGLNDIIESDPELYPYRVSMIGGKTKIRGLPDLSEEYNVESEKARLMNKIEEGLFKKKKIV